MAAMLFIEALPSEIVPVAASRPVSMAAPCPTFRSEVAIEVILFAPNRMAVARKGTDIIKYPATEPISASTA